MPSPQVHAGTWGKQVKHPTQRWKPWLDGDDPVLLDEDRRRAWTERLAVEEPKTLNCDHAFVVLPSTNGQGWRYWRPDRGNSPARPAAQRGHAPAGRRLRRPLM
jgi:hypothetical protein